MPEVANILDASAIGVDFYSPVGVISGLGTAARGYLAALRAARISTAVVPIHEVFFHLTSVGRIEQRQKPGHPIALVHINADSVQRFLHFHSRPFMRAAYKIGIWVWELSALRDEFWHEFRHFDEIWVPSSFCQRAVRSLTSKPVNVMPHVVEVPAPRREIFRRQLGLEDNVFVFLYIFDASSFVERKNPHCLINAFQTAFPNAPDVRLVLKTSNLAIDTEFFHYLNALVGRDARCVVMQENMTAEDVAGLISAADCYVSPHRSEGFGLTVAEAMALGVPAIATDYGGTADFVSTENGFPLGYELVELERDFGPYRKGAIWADPSIADLQVLLRRAVANPTITKAKGDAARKHILKSYSAEAIGRDMTSRLQEIASKL